VWSAGIQVCNSFVKVKAQFVQEEAGRKYNTGIAIHSPRKLKKRSHFGTEYRKALLPRKGKEKSMGIRRIAGLA
jgi:hypothetical protein